MERRDLEQYDFRYENGVLASCGWGISPVEIEPGHEYASYFNMLCVYRPGEQPESLLKEYLRLRFPLPHAACRVTVNPWGGGRFGERINPQFLLDEVEAAADCGAESYQIDDGWQAGGTLAELCSRNRKIDAWEFWRYSERLPDRSLQQLRAVAERHGIELSLWIAPSSNDDYRDWCELRDILLGFYTRDGISCFKLDGTNLRTSRAESKQNRAMRLCSTSISLGGSGRDISAASNTGRCFWKTAMSVTIPASGIIRSALGATSGVWRIGMKCSGFR